MLHDDWVEGDLLIMNSTMTEHDRKVTPPGKTGPVLTRRRFTVGTGLAGAGILLLPSGLRAGQGAPSRKLNIALIGVGGRGTFFYDTIAGENVVALCDINERCSGFHGQGRT